MKTKNIFKSSVFLVLLSLAAIAGCKNDSVIGPTTGQVSFQISQRNGNNNGIEFLFKPNMDVNITRIVSKYNQQQFADTLSSSSTYLYSKDSTYIINEYIGVVNGQQWNFDFTGSVPGQANSNYTVTSNYTVQ